MRGTRLLPVALALMLVAGACGRSSHTPSKDASAKSVSSSCSTKLESTDVGVTSSAITIQVMADVGSPLAPGLFQSNIDAVKAFADAINQRGGLACRKVEVNVWDSKLDAGESKNGLINACSTALAMVGDNSLFNPDVTAMTDCKDKAGATTGVPDLAALANDIHEMCARTLYTVQQLSYPCPIRTGVQPIKAMAGFTRWLVTDAAKGEKLHGLFLVPGDLPTTVQSATPLIAAQRETGITFDATPKVSGRDQQVAYTPRVQAVKTSASNYVYDGSGDRAMISMRKEAKAQGADTVRIWACALGCYTKNFVGAGGADVDGTYAWMQFLPFEEASLNKEATAYLAAVGRDKADAFGAQAWQSAVLFQQAVERVVSAHGPNGLTRANLVAALDGMGDFTANGWMGKKPLKGFSPCFVVVQLRGGQWVRAYPTKPGTFDCDDRNIATVDLDPAAEAAKIR